MIDSAILMAHSVVGRQRVACIITNKRGRVIAVGVNSFTKTSPRQYHYSRRVGKPKQVFLHAEVSALVKCREQPHTAWVVRLKSNGRLGLAKPCAACSLALKEADVKVLYYSQDDETIRRVRM